MLSPLLLLAEVFLWGMEWGWGGDGVGIGWGWSGDRVEGWGWGSEVGMGWRGGHPVVAEDTTTD